MSLSPFLTQTSADATFTIVEAAIRIGVSEGRIREWVSTFRRERRFDGTGSLLLSAKDVEFFSVVKGLRDVDRSCESITRMLAAPQAPVSLDRPVERRLPPAPELDQIETLKAALREMRLDRPARPFWKFWIAR